MKRIVLTLVSAVTLAATGVADHQVAFGSLYPPGSITWEDEYNGVLSTGGEDFVFEIQLPLDFQLAGQDHFLTSVRFDTPGPGQMATFIAGDPVQPLSVQDFAFWAPSANPTNVTTLPYDSQSFVAGGQNFDVDDFLILGGPQLRFQATSYYAYDSPQTLVVAHREFLFDLPTNTPIVIVTPTRFVLTASEVVDSITRRLEYVGSSGLIPAKVLLIDVETGAIEEYPYGPKGFGLPVDEPWVIGPVPPEDLLELQIEVLDETSAPVPDATVFGTTTRVDLFAAGALSEPFELTTDPLGLVEQPFLSAIQLTVTKDGYYHHVTPVMPREDFDSDELTIQLDPELVRVPMIRSFRRVRKKWTDESALINESAPIEVGVRFMDGYGPESHLAMTDDEFEADVWFEITPSGSAYGPNNEPYFRDWEVIVTGLNDWDLAMGLTWKEADEGGHMREAPTGKYSSKLQYKVSTLPNGLYVRHDGGQRYGKIWDLEFSQAPKSTETLRLFFLSYSVQESPVGTRSLNPVGVSDFGR